MAETEDKEGKTEDPTEHRLKTALEKGNIPVSREVSALGPLLGVCAVLLLIGDEPILRLVQYLARIFDNAGAIELVGQGDVAALMWQTAAEAAFVVGPIVAVLALSGLLPSFLQNQPQLLGERIRPQGSRISPSAGFKRIFGARGLGEFAKSGYAMNMEDFIKRNPWAFADVIPALWNSTKYQGKVFIADYSLGWIKELTFDSQYTSLISERMLDSTAGAVVKLSQGPDGNIYQLNIFPGTLSVIAPSAGNRAPTAVIHAYPAD